MQGGGEGIEDHPRRDLLCDQETQASCRKDQRKGVDRGCPASHLR